MKSFGLGNCVLGVVFAIPVLAGCGGSQTLIAAPGGAQQSVRNSLPFSAAQGDVVAGAKDDDSPSWMAPDAHAQDLLYVTNTKTVTVYSYPRVSWKGSYASGIYLQVNASIKRGRVHHELGL